MPLSIADLEKIEKNHTLGWKRDKFTDQGTDLVQLKNIDGHCIFFDPGTISCLIYEFRPVGCQYYPMVFDVDQNKCILDSDCPHKHRFFKHKPDFERNCRELRKWIHQSLLQDGKAQ